MAAILDFDFMPVPPATRPHPPPTISGSATVCGPCNYKHQNQNQNQNQNVNVQRTIKNQLEVSLVYCANQTKGLMGKN